MVPAMTSFAERLTHLPRLGVGISCEFNGGTRALNLDALHTREAYPELIHFLEVGTDVSRGLDEHMRRWVETGLPTTYHFLDINLEESEDLDAPWIAATNNLADSLNASWLCGDAGLWHFGGRERGHFLLLPPILCDSSAREMATTIATLQEKTNRLVLPENPPATAFVGPLHLLEYYARVVESADCGFLLDCAHLAIFQAMRGHEPLDGLEDFPLDRIIEVHIAGGEERESHGFTYIDDTHSPAPLDACWEIFDYVQARARNLRAVVYECEHNLLHDVIPVFEKLNQRFPKLPEDSQFPTPPSIV